jgi:vacuolar-type H+-ATPase subunit D/Vma8
MISEAERSAHRRNAFEAKIATLPKLWEDLDKIGAQLVDRERTRFNNIVHLAILKLRVKAEAPLTNKSSRG